MKLRETVALFSMLAFVVGCKDDAGKTPAPAKAPAAHDHVHGPHDGEILELGEEEGHLEMLHDGIGGNLTVYVFGKDLKTPLAIEAPTILVQTKEGTTKEFKLVPFADAPGGKSDAWKGSSPALAADPLNGRIRVNIGGKEHQSRLQNPEHKH